MESEGLVALVVPNSGVTVRLLGGSLASCSEPPPSSYPPTASRKSSHISRKQTSKTTSRSNQLKIPNRSRPITNGDQGRLDISRQYLEKRLNKNYDVRYITTLKKYLDKFIESSRQVSCDQLECPSLQARLHHHRHKHHSPQTPQRECCRDSIPNETRSCCRERKHSCPMSAKEPCLSEKVPESASLNSTEVPRRSYNDPANKVTSPEEIKENHSVQTKITFADLGHLTINIDSDVKTRANSAQSEKIENLKSIDLHSNDFPSNQARFERDDNNNINYYRENLRDEINKWLLNVPFSSNTTPEAKMEKDNTLNNFIERIYNLASEVDNPNYENMVKYEIYEYLDELKIRNPGAKRDQASFKQGLCLSLWVTIKDVNDKWLGFRNYNDQQKKKRTYYNLNPLRERTCGDSMIRCTMDTNSICNNKNKTKRGMVRCTMDSKPICNNKNKTKRGSCKTKCNNPYKDEIDCEISDWLNKLNLYRQNGSGMTKRTIINIMLYRLNPYLNQPMTEATKNTLKDLIVEILEDLPISINYPSNTGLLTKFSDDLASRLLWIQAKFESNKCKKCKVPTSLQCVAREIIHTIKEPKTDLFGELRECLRKTNLENLSFIEEELIDIILENMESIRIGNVKDVESDILVFLQESGELTQAEMANIAKLVIDNVKNIVLLNDERGAEMTSMNKPGNSAILSVYTSEHELTRLRTTSVVSNTSIKQHVSEEKTYINKITKIIKTWIDTLPQKSKIDENIKQIMIKELVEKITDDTILEQISIKQRVDNNAAKMYLVNRWLHKFNFGNEADRNTTELINELKEIPTPAKSLLSYQECEPACSLEYFVSRARVSLLDAIFAWVNEQPSRIYSNDNVAYRNKKVEELAEKLKPLIVNKRSDKEKSVAIAEWLRETLTTQDRKKINAMAVNLTERLNNENLEETAVLEKKTLDESLNTPNENFRLEFERPMAINQSTSSPNISEPYKDDPDKTMKEFIIKFIQHNSDVDDSTARGAFAELLEIEIQKLSTPSRKEIYEFFQESPQEKFSPIRLDSELKYIKDIIDWLKNIPVDSIFNARGNKKRIGFCINLARDIAKVENDRRKNHDATENNKNLESTVEKYMTQLLINPNQQGNINLMIHQLLNRIISRRKNLAAADENYALTNPHPNLTDFIEDYIRTNGHEIAEDDLKLEVCSDRLLKEIKQVICSHDPTAFTKTGVYSRLAEDNVQRDVTLKNFNIKLAYAEEISDWIKNLPLLHKIDEGRIHLISELAEKIAESKRKNAFHPKNTQLDVELEIYVKNWISKLPLDKKKEVVAPIVIKQLLSRIEKVNLKNRSIDNVVGEAKKGCCCGTPQTTLPGKSFSSPRSKLVKQLKSSLSKAKSSSSIKLKKSMLGRSHAASWIVKSVENWTENLPIEGGDDEDVKIVKNNIAMKLFQKLGELNVNQRFYKDNALYNDVLSDEIDVQLENLPQNMKLTGDKENIKEGLLKTIAESKREINEKTAGESYRHRLENIIESSMPHPVQLQEREPGFEIYKNRLASIFILENFDHGNETSKLKYEKRIKREIDKYFQNAQNRNAIPWPKDQMYNELYSILYKVPVPNENSLLVEVEEVKMKCEVDDWFEELPLKTSTSLSELLEWDQIRSILAKRLNEMEHDPEHTDKKHKEIIKWLIKLPILPGKNIDELANNLENKLKSSTEERKSTPSRKYWNSDKKFKSANYVFKSEDYPSTFDNSKTCINRQIPKKSADLIIEIVENWCNQIHSPTNRTLEHERSITMTDDLVTKIIIKVSELNSNPETFNDDLLYNHLLGKELDKLLSTLPDNDNLRKSKDARKHQLIEEINSIKPIIREERARHEYRNELNDTIQNILEKPASNTAEKIAFNYFRDEVVDDFVEYYHRDDDEGKQFFKMKIHNAMREYLKKAKDDKDKRNIPTDPMIRGNQLLCELAKVPIPNEAAVTDEVQEIRMKKQVEEFFDNLPKDSNEKKDLRNQIKTSLAKRLNEIEKTSHSAENDQKMKREITKSLKKLGHEISSQKIDTFIGKLKLNEMARKAPLARKYDSYTMHSNTPDWINKSTSPNTSPVKKKCCNLPNCKRSRRIQEELDQLQSMDTSPQSPGRPGPSDQARQGPTPRDEHFTLKSPPQVPQYHGSVGNSTRLDNSFSPRGQGGVGNVSGPPGDYSQFEGEALKTSSKGQIADSFQRQAHSGPFQNQSDRPGVTGRQEILSGGQGQQSLGPDSISEVEWQSTLSSGGGFSPFQNQSGRPGVTGRQEIKSGGQRQQSLGPDSISEVEWQSTLSSGGGFSPFQNQSVRPGVTGRQEIKSGGQRQQSLGPDSISEVEWQSTLSSRGGFDLSQGPIIPQSPARPVPPTGMDISMSPYASSGQQRGGQTMPGQPWQKGQQGPVGSPGGAFNQSPAMQSFGTQQNFQADQQSFVPASGNNRHWQSEPPGTQQPGQQSFAPVIGNDGQWQSIFESPGIQQPGQQSFTPVIGNKGQWQSIFESPGIQQPGQQSFTPVIGNKGQWQSIFESSGTQQYGQQSFAPVLSNGGQRQSILESPVTQQPGQQSFAPRLGNDVQWQSMSEPTGSQQDSMQLFQPGQQSFRPASPRQVHQSFRPASGGDEQWQPTLGFSGPQLTGQQSFSPQQRSPPVQQSFRSTLPQQAKRSFASASGHQQSSMQHYQPDQQSFDPTSVSDEQWQSMFGSSGPQQPGHQSFRTTLPRPGQQSFVPVSGNDVQWQSMLETTGPQQGHMQHSQPGHQSFVQASPRQGLQQFDQPSRPIRLPSRGLESSMRPYASGGQQKSDQLDGSGLQSFSPAGNVSEFKIPWQDESSIGPSGAGVIPRKTTLGGQAQQSFGPDTGSRVQWNSMSSAGGPEQLGISQGRLQSPERLYPPQGLHTSLNPNASGGQQPISSQPWQQGSVATGGEQSFGPVSGSVEQWGSMLSSSGPQQFGISQGRPQSPGRLHPSQGLQTSISPYVSDGQQPGFDQPRPQGPVIIGNGGQQSFGSGSGSARQQQTLLPTSSPERVERGLPQSPARPLIGLETSMSPYATEGQQGQTGRGGQSEPVLSSSVRGKPMAFRSPSPQPIRQFHPKFVSDSTHPSRNSVQEWNSQSSAGPQVIHHRAIAMLHEPPARTGVPGQRSGVVRSSLHPRAPQRQDQIYHDPYISKQYGPGDAWNPQQAGGAQASLGQSGVSYQGFQGASPFSSSLKQSQASGQQRSSGQANQTLIPITRSPQSAPALPLTPQGSYHSLDLPTPPMTAAMQGPRFQAVDTSVIGPYLLSPASAPQITPGEMRAFATGREIPRIIDDEIFSDDDDCICERQLRMLRRRRHPMCAIPVLEFCESCQCFPPFLTPYPFPGYHF